MLRVHAVGSPTKMLARVGWLVVFVLAIACTKDKPVQSKGIAVKVAPVKRTSDVAGTRYSAQIVPHTRLDLAFKVGGYVESIAQVKGVDGAMRNLQEGDVVEEGQELAALRKTDYGHKIAEAKAALAQASAMYRDAKREAERDSKLEDKGSLPGAVADASRGRRDSAAAAAEGARVRLQQAQSAYGDTTLRAPMSGVVVKRAIEVGALAAPGTVAFAIADVDNVKAMFGVPDVFLSQIEVGASHKVTTDAFPGVEFEGKVSRLAPAADQRSRVFEVDITIPNKEGKLKPGMVASLKIKAAASTAVDVPLVPLNAIVRPPSGKGYAVFVVETQNGITRVKAREVELGEYLGRVVPVKSGLAVDENVVVQGTGLLSDGDRVEVIP
jgi:multidrug efflux system membrane fusion protein